MKQKTGRKLLSFLLTLAMLVGLMPAMSLTAHADGFVASVTSSSDTTTNYATFSDAVSAWNAAEGNATLKLLSDVTTTSSVNVKSTKTLDLNGHGIIGGGFTVIVVEDNNGDLTITDSNPNAVHGYVISAPLNDNGAGLATVHSTKQDGDTEFKGGYITGGGKSGGGTNWSGQGGAIGVRAGKCSVTGCTLIGNQPNHGGGVNVMVSGSLSMSGTAVIGNKSEGHGGGVYNSHSSGTVTLTNCLIQYNYAEWYGGGIAVYRGSVIVDGGKIVNNASDTAGDGGGVGLWNYGIGSSLVLKGDVTIKDNKVKTTDENLSLTDAVNKTFVKIDGALTCAEGSIGVTMATPGVFTKTSDENKEAWNDVSKFTSDNTSYAVGKNASGQLLLSAPVTVTFDANTHGTDPDAQTVASGGVVTKPDDLTADGRPDD